MISDPFLQNILKLLAASLNGAASCDLPDMTAWQEMKKELNAHAVLPLVGNSVLRAGVSGEEQLDILKSVAVNVRTFHKLMSAQTALLELLDANSIPSAILKGAAAAQYYPDPALRQYGDIDILVLPEDYERTFRLLIDSGYKNLAELDDLYQRHIGFVAPSGIEIELHRFFSDYLREEQNALLDGWLYEQLRNTHRADIGSYMAPVFPATENGLVILVHINHHLRGGLGLRQIIDWMMFVRAVLNDDFWETQFREKAEAIGMAYLAKVVTKMCQMYLGLTGDIEWCADADEELADELMLYIFSAGNFGQKVERSERNTRTVLCSLLIPSKAFRYLIEGGMIHMEEAGLKPRKSIAWLYQIGHLLSEGLRHRKDIHLLSGAKTASQTNDLLKRLGTADF